MDLFGNVAFITGSASGLGKGFAEALLEKGVKVFISDINTGAGTAALTEFEGKFGSDNVRFMPLDVYNEDQFEDVFNAAVAAFGQIDLMVNNAGVLNEAAWKLMLKVNLFGVVKGTKLAEEHMRKDRGGKGGRIINISSMAGLLDLCIFPVYCATKHAVRSFTISQASQYDIDAKGIEYGVICPKAAHTNLMKLGVGGQVNYYEHAKIRFQDLMPVSRVVDAFMDLVQLEQMNGAILKVTNEEKTFQHFELVDLGPTYTSAVRQVP